MRKTVEQTELEWGVKAGPLERQEDYNYRENKGYKYKRIITENNNNKGFTDYLPNYTKWKEGLKRMKEGGYLFQDTNVDREVVAPKLNAELNNLNTRGMISSAMAPGGYEWLNHTMRRRIIARGYKNQTQYRKKYTPRAPRKWVNRRYMPYLRYTNRPYYRRYYNQPKTYSKYFTNKKRRYYY